MIGIVDYGVGNLSSIKNALDRLGYKNKIVDNEKDLLDSDALILPGVGAFKDAMRSLYETGLIDSLKQYVDYERPLLGICLGLQLLFEKSYEDGECKGLGFLKGEIVKFSGDLKVPHMGWNSLKIAKNDDILKYTEEDEQVYFIHSYYLNNMEDVLAYSNYGIRVPAIVGKNKIYGIQFHPEKSGDTGMKILKAFGEMI